MDENEEKFPIWADRQRNKQQDKDVRMRSSLEELISDIQDEARRTDVDFKSESVKALHAGGDPRSNEAPKRCKTCNSKFHITDNCLYNNEDRRRAWEDRTGKKWLSKEE
ncbi:hypothetical protein HI914_00978 [Erysiphe necator]|nr:hypothetical protein HI914_00978 [Erysiphe necator]